MATTPVSRRRETRTDLTGDDRDPLNPMREPLSSLDEPASRSNPMNDVNLAPGETLRRSGNLGTTAEVRNGRSFTSTFAVVAVILLVAFLAAFYFGNNRSTIATGSGTTQAPIADSNTGTTSTDTTGSTTPAPQAAPGSSTTTVPQQTAPAMGTSGSSTGTTTAPAPANP